MAAPYARREKADRDVFEVISQLRKNAIARIIPSALMLRDPNVNKLFYVNWESATIGAIASILFYHNDTRADRDFQHAFDAEVRRRRSDDNNLDQHIPHIISQDIVYVHEDWDRERRAQQSTYTSTSDATTTGASPLQDDSNSGATLCTRSGAPDNSRQGITGSMMVEDLTNVQGDTNISEEGDALDTVHDSLAIPSPNSGDDLAVAGHDLPNVSLGPLHIHMPEIGTVNRATIVPPVTLGSGISGAKRSADDALWDSYWNEHRQGAAHALQEQILSGAGDASSETKGVTADIAATSAPVSLGHSTASSASNAPEPQVASSLSMDAQPEATQAGQAMDSGSSYHATGVHASLARTDKMRRQDSALTTKKAGQSTVLGGSRVENDVTIIEPATGSEIISEPHTIAAITRSDDPHLQGSHTRDLTWASASNGLSASMRQHNELLDSLYDDGSRNGVNNASAFPTMQSAPDQSSLIDASFCEDVSCTQDGEAVAYISQAELDHHNKISCLELLKEKTGAGLEQVLPIKLWPHDIEDRTSLDSVDIDTAEWVVAIVTEWHGKLSPAEMRGTVTKAAKLRQQDQCNESRHIVGGIAADVKDAYSLCQELVDRRAQQRLVMRVANDQPQSSHDGDQTSATPATELPPDEEEGYSSDGSIHPRNDAKCTTEGSTKARTRKRRGRGPFGHYAHKIKLKRITLTSAQNRDLKVRMRLRRLWARRDISKYSGIVQAGDDYSMQVSADAEVQESEDKDAQPSQPTDNATSPTQSSVQSNGPTASRPSCPMLRAEGGVLSREVEFRMQYLLRGVRAATSKLGRSATRHNRGQGIYRHAAAVASIKITYSPESVALLHSVNFVYVPNRGGLSMTRLSTNSRAYARAQQNRACLDRDFIEFKVCLGAYCNAQAKYQDPVVLLKKIVFGARHDETRREYLQGWWESWGDQHSMDDTSYWRSIARLVDVEPSARLETSEPPTQESVDWQVIGYRGSASSGVAFDPLGKIDNTAFRNEELDDVCWRLLQTLTRLKMALNDELKAYFKRDTNRLRPVRIVYKSRETRDGRRQYMGFGVEKWQSQWGMMSDTCDEMEAELDDVFEHLLIPLDEALVAHAGRARELGHNGDAHAVIALGYEGGLIGEFGVKCMRVMQVVYGEEGTEESQSVIRVPGWQ